MTCFTIIFDLPSHLQSDFFSLSKILKSKKELVKKKMVKLQILSPGLLALVCITLGSKEETNKPLCQTLGGRTPNVKHAPLGSYSPTFVH